MFTVDLKIIEPQPVLRVLTLAQLIDFFAVRARVDVAAGAAECSRRATTSVAAPCVVLAVT